MMKLPLPRCQYRFDSADHLLHPKVVRAWRTASNRPILWRSDFAFLSHKLLVEVEGGIWINGGHNRGKIYSDNCLKYSAASVLGYSALRCTPDHISDGIAIRMLEAWFKEREK